ncbi:MAG TPA: VOC family protein [Thermoleophilia bacterium]|jgi:predicted enzyme related to lactoylglutathione lyase|nr:VOC family protein [Thermoleophilia bacterium]
MDLKLARCFLTIDDHDKALAFYRDVLGFEVRRDVEADGVRRVSVSPPSQPDLEIVLETAGADLNTSPADRQVIAELMAKGALSRAVFTTPDCDATFERILASGAEVMQEPMDQPDGVRDCVFRDPAGNLLRFNQPRTA